MESLYAITLILEISLSKSKPLWNNIAKKMKSLTALSIVQCLEHGLTLQIIHHSADIGQNRLKKWFLKTDNQNVVKIIYYYMYKLNKIITWK